MKIGYARVLAQLIAGDRSQREVAKALGVSPSTLRESMKQRRGRKGLAKELVLRPQASL